MERTRHEFDVIRLWEQPTDTFFDSPGLLPFAVLSQVDDRAQILQQVSLAIDQLLINGCKTTSQHQPQSWLR